MPVAALNISPYMCGVVPWPKPQFTLPGLALAWSISCLTEVTGIAGLTTRTQPHDETVATGAKSLAGSRPTILDANKSLIPPNSRVWPSGAALANSPTPIVPPPPGRFSTMTGLPRRLANSFDTRRAVTSITDPEEIEQMTLITLLG